MVNAKSEIRSSGCLVEAGDNADCFGRHRAAIGNYEIVAQVAAAVGDPWQNNFVAEVFRSTLAPYTAIYDLRIARYSCSTRTGVSYFAQTPSPLPAAS
jgi:hypothetical protein